ncbi:MULTISPECIES: LacI family DNA-binding transcriptional regulator [unclassified Neorhizobium]|uniref:LacI family DNA-binding transcriptional regulator n=1 Tax=unclassified Neorhizobium TaxID=2629175 RepID=UPI001FF459A0|nr:MULTISPECIES: LacI family DNA-binding transcriptional regulator [unclassified Neorhizobium]MCJ9670052.1 LacI family DNA-binding transcriptional regulator [Neorhizobium sp. SHOUNA12B]MCJ9746037.1 LacI family DNA-binding transcriptional regulator [Neorhizobium sp. SHOUNA12A]
MPKPPPKDAPNNTGSVRRPTMAEIARLAGVDTSTVSRALAGSPRVTEETRALIDKIVHETGYVVNETARKLRGGRANQILVIVSDIAAPFYSDVVQGIVEWFAERSINVLLGVTLRQPKRESQLAKQLLTGAVDGIITVTGSLPKSIAGLQDIHRKVVGISRPIPHEGVTSVVINNYQAAREAMAYLRSRGHERIAYIGGPTYSQTFRDRCAAYTEVMEEANVPEHITVRSTDTFVYDTDSGFRLMKSILNESIRPTAVFCANDELAIGAMAASREAGWKTPEEISFFGFDDLKITEMLSPPLSTISVPRFEMGRKGAELLYRQLYENAEPSGRVVLEHRMILRDSVTDV